MGTNDERRIGPAEVDSLLRSLLVIDVEPDKAMIDEEIIRRRLAIL